MNNTAIFCNKTDNKLTTDKGGGGYQHFIRSIPLSITAHKKIFTMGFCENKLKINFDLNNLFIRLTHFHRTAQNRSKTDGCCNSV